jgi:PilZ domain-containing protein
MTNVHDQDNKAHRKHERFSFIEEILIDGINKCTSADISEGGIFISTIQRCEKGEVIELIIPTKAENIKVKAQVKYCQPGIGVGLEFIDLNDVMTAKIKELVESITPKSD